MKNKNEKRQSSFIPMLLLLTFASGTCFSQEDVVENIEKTFPVSKNTMLNIDTKYGDVDIRDWEKREVNIEVKIIIHDLNSQKARQVLENIDIDIHEEGNDIYVRTSFDDDFFRIIGNDYHTDNKKFEINYVIQMPSDLRVTLNNKYGNIFINKLESESVISLKYGNLKVNHLYASGKENMTELNLGYSNGTIENCQWIKLNIKYSKLNIQNSQALIILSKYSKVNIEKNSSIVCESKYDTYNIGKISNFVAEAQYSNFRFDKLINKLRIRTKYTDTKIDYIPPTFELIEIENSYGSVKIGIDPDASYSLDGYAKYAKIQYPSDARVNRFQENTEMTVKGIVGNKKDNLPVVNVETKYGGIALIR
ncbi:MAG: DUF4097 family beta strand repeat-containing protein [Bacteroidales bacterium]|jgi:hypothetical protein